MKKSYDDIVQELADLDVKYLNLHREWRKEKADRIRLENEIDKWKRAYHKIDPVGFMFNDPLKED